MGDSLNTSFWVMVLIQTIGSVDMPGRGSRKMPSPRQYVAIVVAWIVLMLVAGIGQQAKRAATAVAWVMVLSGIVLGPFGKRLVGFFGIVTKNFPTVPAPTSPPLQPFKTAQQGVSDTNRLRSST